MEKSIQSLKESASLQSQKPIKSIIGRSKINSLWIKNIIMRVHEILINNWAKISPWL